MQRLVLADTGPLYALAMARDALHERARGELAVLQSRSYGLLVAWPTLLETHNLLLRRETPAFSRRYLAALQSGSALINPLMEDYSAALELTAHFADQAISMHDATLAILSQRLDTATWTFDHHFDLMGVSVWRA